jgi:hypothetical protein
MSTVDQTTLPTTLPTWAWITIGVVALFLIAGFVGAIIGVKRRRGRAHEESGQRKSVMVGAQSQRYSGQFAPSDTGTGEGSVLGIEWISPEELAELDEEEQQRRESLSDFGTGAEFGRGSEVISGQAPYIAGTGTLYGTETNLATSTSGYGRIPTGEQMEAQLQEDAKAEEKARRLAAGYGNLPDEGAMARVLRRQGSSNVQYSQLPPDAP